MKLHVRVEDHGVKAMMTHLATHHPGVMARGMNRTIFDVREAEAKMVAQAFDYWSAVTRSFIAGEKSFPFELAKPGRLQAKLFAGGTGGRSATAEIFAKHETGFTLKPGEGKQLELGNRPPAYAIPTDDKDAHLRTPRGRVPKSRTPAALLAIPVKGGSRPAQGGFSRFRRRRRRKKGIGNLGTHVFISPNDKAILEITPGGGRRVLYSLYQRPTRVDEHIEFFNTATVVIDNVLMTKLLQEWDKSFGRFGA